MGRSSCVAAVLVLFVAACATGATTPRHEMPPVPPAYAAAGEPPPPVPPPAAPSETRPRASRPRRRPSPVCPIARSPPSRNRACVLACSRASRTGWRLRRTERRSSSVPRARARLVAAGAERALPIAHVDEHTRFGPDGKTLLVAVSDLRPGNAVPAAGYVLLAMPSLATLARFEGTDAQYIDDGRRRSSTYPSSIAMAPSFGVFPVIPDAHAGPRHPWMAIMMAHVDGSVVRPKGETDPHAPPAGDGAQPRP